MFDYINNFLGETLQWLKVPYFGPIDLIEIIILQFAVYFLQKELANTRMWTIVKGIVYLLMAYGVFLIFNMQVLAQIFLLFIGLCLIGIVLALQPEIKKILESTGSKDYIKELLKFKGKDKQVPLTFQDKTVDALVTACEDMSETKTGALIVFELDTPLEDIIATGQKMDAVIQKALLLQTFVKNTPLHDGAMVIKNDRIDSATCYLPLSSNTKISKDLGTRHRAGIGVTEQVNCFVLIVQEETGAISWAENGKLKHKVQLKELRQKLTDIQHRKDVNYNQKKRKIKNKENIQSVVEKRVLHNIREKTLAVICATMLWFTVLNFINPVTTRRIQDIPVKAVNTDAITQSDQTYDIVQGTSTQIIVKGRRDIVDSLDESGIVATADFTNINAAYAVPIDINLPQQYSESIEVQYESVKSMQVELDKIAETQVALTYNIQGESKSGTYVSQASSDITEVKISGPSKLIQTIDKVQLDVDVTGRSNDFTTNIIPKVYDRNGAIIDNSRLELSNDSIKVQVAILKTKTVPLNISIVNDNKDIKVQNLAYDVQEIHLAGDEEALQEIESISISVDVTSDLQEVKQQRLVKVIDINEYLSNGIQIAGDSKINMSMDVEKQVEKEIELQGSQIQVNNLGDKLEIENDEAGGDNSDGNENWLNKTYKIKIKAYENEIDSITVQDIQPYIDLHSLKAGEHDVEIKSNGASTQSEQENGQKQFALVSSDIVHVSLKKKA